jgi:phosphoglycerol transferase MdoB-like AlkP superfamily enzyme
MTFVLNQFVRLLKFFIFWMIFFWLDKVFFLLFNFEQTRQLTITEIFGIFGYGLKMDVSTASYLLVIPGLMISLRPFVSSLFVNRFIRIYTIIFLIICTFLVVLDLGLYPHWGTRVNITAFNYIDDPVAMSASVSIGDVLQGLLIAGSLLVAFGFLYRRLFPDGIAIKGEVRLHEAFLQLILVATLILPIRGGLDTSPLNLSSVAFSSKLYVNQAASNYLWNFAKSVEKRKRLSNPCNYMPKDESVRLFNQFMKKDSVVSRPQLIKLNPQKRPNVILVILESFSNKVIAPLGGLLGIAPNLDSLCSKSTVFTNFYSTGNRSDRGISAVLGGYPSLLSTSIMVYPEKARSLTLLPEYFNRHNYNTSFYYGGDINFYNLKTFVLQSNCGKITTKANFPSELGRMSKWGVPDGYVFSKALEDLKSEQEPFMKTIYTVSSHPPYDVPYSRIKGSSNEAKYLNSVAYTDSCLGAFIDGFRKSPLWNNTLLIITADHGHMEPGPTDITDPASYRIPLIWSGGVVDSLQRIETITQQVDFGTSLVHQLGWEADSSIFAKDFFTSRPFAFYMLDSGWGYVTSEGEYYFDQNIHDFALKPNQKTLNDKQSPKAYMQVLHDDFIGR